MHAPRTAVKVRVAFITDRECGQGHISREEALTEALEGREHEVVSTIAQASWVIVNHYQADWLQIPFSKKIVDLDDWGLSHPRITINWQPVGLNAIIRKAFREVRWQGDVSAPVLDVRSFEGLSASMMAQLMANCSLAFVPPSVIAWEAVTVGCPINVSAPAVDNQRETFKWLCQEETRVCDGRGVERLVDEMEARS